MLPEGAHLKTVFTKETASEYGKRGAIKSAESRRRKADLRKAINMFLVSGEVYYDGIKMTAEMAVVRALIEKALRGDVNAYKAILSTLGTADRSELDEKEQKARIKKLEKEVVIMENKMANGTDEALKVVIVDDIPKPAESSVPELPAPGESAV